MNQNQILVAIFQSHPDLKLCLFDEFQFSFSAENWEAFLYSLALIGSIDNMRTLVKWRASDFTEFLAFQNFCLSRFKNDSKNLWKDNTNISSRKTRQIEGSRFERSRQNYFNFQIRKYQDHPPSSRCLMLRVKLWTTWRSPQEFNRKRFPLQKATGCLSRERWIRNTLHWRMGMTYWWFNPKKSWHFFQQWVKIGWSR